MVLVLPTSTAPHCCSLAAPSPLELAATVPPLGPSIRGRESGQKPGEYGLHPLLECRCAECMSIPYLTFKTDQDRIWDRPRSVSRETARYDVIFIIPQTVSGLAASRPFARQDPTSNLEIANCPLKARKKNKHTFGVGACVNISCSPSYHPAPYWEPEDQLRATAAAWGDSQQPLAGLFGGLL
ncbi:hypothetical protein B0T22DRAFT_59935 [Podospora appendiculata]|uniref:Uncharacterized protein n=1 Tax=Podospora appendiculata TaxID=314037 RepID=A0AAE1CH85_9PEZI|nr:hypothetical protein B0T22DRAFT_59935 [Podospora appendiculata]